MRQIWVRLPDGELTEIPWIHRDHVHQPFDERTWQHIKTLALYGDSGDAEQHEADLADALDQLQRRVNSGHATKTEQALVARTPAARHPQHDTAHHTDAPAQYGNDDSIDGLDDLPDDHSATAATGFGLYDASEEADKW
ncbi:hypothetical protein AB0A82_23210 [Streptomyces chrestomyceticus]